MTKQKCADYCVVLCGILANMDRLFLYKNVDKKLERNQQKESEKCTEEHTKKPCRGTAF